MSPEKAIEVLGNFVDEHDSPFIRDKECDEAIDVLKLLANDYARAKEALSQVATRNAESESMSQYVVRVNNIIRNYERETRKQERSR
jgi:hypothetical protein